MGRATSVEVIHTRQSWEDMGRELGRRCSESAKGMVRDVKSDLERKGIAWEIAIARGRHFLPFAKEYDGVYIDYLKEFSKGSGIPFEHLFTLICEGEKHLCTDVMVNSEATSDGSVYSAHTEDWSSASQDHIVMIHGEPKGGPSFLVMSIAGFEFISGMNSDGLSFSGNSLYPDDERVGVPKRFVARRILVSRRIGEALEAAAPPNRASSYNNNICHSSGEMYCVEASATDLAVLSAPDGYLVHTNHYLDPRMERHENHFSGPGGRSLSSGSGTLVRYHRALRLVRRNLGNITKDALVNILSDHVNYPDSICNHEDSKLPALERSKTTYAVISDLSRLEMHACLGNPCEGRWKRYDLH